MSQDVNALVDDITERVKRRLDALRAGTEQPCTAGPAKAAAPTTGSAADCGTSCGVCPNHDSCGTSLSVRNGLTERVTPDKIGRASCRERV